MNLINKEHAITRRLYLIKDLLQPLLKFTTILGPGDKGPDIEG